MNNAIPLEYGKYYHVYNRGINSCELFSEKTNYEYFHKQQHELDNIKDLLIDD